MIMSSPRQPLNPADDQSSSAEIDVPSAHGEIVADACLAVVGGSEAGRIFALIHRESIIGRGPNAQVRVDDGAISTKHAKIVWDGKHHTLVDLGSTNGTFLNGRRLEPNEAVTLNFGDSIQVADIVLAYLENRRDEAHGHTQQLARLAPQMPASAALRMPDPQMIAQLLQSGFPTEPERAGPSLDEQIDKALRVIAFLRRNWVPIFAATALLAFIGTISVFLSPPPTEATVKLRIALKSSENLGENPSREEIAQFYSAAQQNFVAPKLVEQTLKDLKGANARFLLPGTMASLTFNSAGLGTYSGSFKHKDPEYAFRFLDKHLKNYLVSEVERTIRGNSAEVDFIEGRLKENETELRKTEEELRAFKAKHLEGLPDFTNQHFVSRETLQSRRADLSAQLQKTSLELALARKRLKEAAPLLSKRVDSAAPYQTALIETRRKLGELKAKNLGPQHPEVIAAQKQLEEMERLSQTAQATEATELERNANPGLLELRNRVGDLEVASGGTQAELGAVSAQLARLDHIVKEMPEVEARYAQLTRSYDSSQQLHAKLFERLRTSQLKLELERSSASARYEVISPVESSGVPLQKALLQRTGIGIGAGLAIGLMLAAFLEVRRYLARRRTRNRSRAMTRVGYTAGHNPGGY
jgi:uncharacterized protein involved in exopolysaccharide biosynthesis